MIAIGSDHGGFALKQAVMKHLESRGEQYRDFGTYSEASCDYPDSEPVSAFPLRPTKCTGFGRHYAGTAFPLRRPDYIMTRMFLQWEPVSSERGWR